MLASGLCEFNVFHNFKNPSPLTDANVLGICRENIALYTSCEWPKYVLNDVNLLGSH